MNKPAFRPIGLRYLVLPDQIKEKTIDLGDYQIQEQGDVHKKSTAGTIVARGQGCTELDINDRVAYGEYSGYEQDVEGVKYLILQESELLGQIL